MHCPRRATNDRKQIPCICRRIKLILNQIYDLREIMSHKQEKLKIIVYSFLLLYAPMNVSFISLCCCHNSHLSFLMRCKHLFLLSCPPTEGGKLVSRAKTMAEKGPELSRGGSQLGIERRWSRYRSW